jgi:hypothetical protein
MLTTNKGFSVYSFDAYAAGKLGCTGSPLTRRTGRVDLPPACESSRNLEQGRLYAFFTRAVGFLATSLFPLQ